MVDMTTEEKVRENKARRRLDRRGYRLMKSRRRDPKALEYGGYMIVDSQTNGAVAGMDPVPFDYSLGDVEAFLDK